MPSQRISHFKVPGLYTVSINRSNNVVIVRQYRQHRTFELPLSCVAGLTVLKVARAELALKPKRKARRS